MEHQQDIGGRFSVFSNVGMVPAIIAGMDVNEIFEGAKSIINNEDYSNYYNLANIFNDSNHINLKSSVIMTYSDNLYYFGKWYLLLWSESIGIENLNRMNQGGGGGGVNVSISGNVMSQEFVEGELRDQIVESVRRGIDFA